jgi:DNA invertase Pin-like site-specific DNA recombinase
VFRDEGISRAASQRAALRKCLKMLQAGDTLIVWKLNRLGRSLRDLIHMLDDLKRRGVKFRSLITERTRANVKPAQRRGMKFGRKPKLSTPQIAHARQLIESRQRVQDVWRHYLASDA